MLKKVILIFLGCMCLSAVYANTHKQRMIEYVNNGEYAQAAKELPLVEEWTFDWNEPGDYIHIQKGYELYQSLDTISIDKPIRDSLLIYIAKRCDSAGHYYFNNKQYSSALPYYEWSLGVRKSILGENHPDYAEILGFLCSTYRNCGEYTKAEECCLRGLKIIEDSYGKHHQKYAYFLKKLGSLYVFTGEYAKTQECYLQALDIYQSISNKNENHYAQLLSDLGNVSRRLQQLEKADYYYSLLLNVMKENFGENSIEYANQLVNISYFYIEMGDYYRAFDDLQKAWEIQTSLYEKNDPIFIDVYVAWGYLNRLSMHYPDAIKYYSKALDLIKTFNGEESLGYAEGLTDLGLSYDGNDQYAEASKCYQQAIDIRSKIFEKRWPDDAILLNNMSSIYKEMGDYAKAEESLLSALEILQSYPEEVHNLHTFRNNLGLLYYDQRKYLKAEQYLLPGILLEKDQYVHSLTYLSEKQRELFLKTFDVSFKAIMPSLAYSLYPDKQIISCDAYDNELFFKGALLQSSEAIKRSVQESGDTILIRQWNELSELKQAILHLRETDPNSEYIKEYELKAEQIEKEITKSSAAYRDNQAMWQITWDSVRNHLKKGQVAIEYMVAPINEDSTMYCALLLRRNSKYPELIPLFEEKEVKSRMNANTENQFYSSDPTGQQISSLVWNKVLPKIKKGETIYFAPSGLLHQLAIEALPYDSTHTMGDVYNMVRLSSTREIILNKSSKEQATATLYGGIQYNMEADELLAESEAYATMNLLASRGIESDTLNRGSVKYLAGTKREVENISKMLRDNHLQVQLFTSTAANEESFKAISGTHQNILHIATHGFFWTDSTAVKKTYFTQRKIDLDIKPVGPIINPLSRCGLLFAGANIALQGHSNELPEGVQDGILTAKEISLLNLRDADLVVLSACETGKGEISGDGVFGLQRAFKMAGVQTIIMSLWPVNDAATQMLMTEFYRNWIMDHQAKREAFRNAQNAVRAKYKEPIYWAGFVMLD